MKATGYACDVCKTFATSASNDRPPNGWMTLRVEVAAQSSLDSFHICSNRCLRDLGRERWRAETRDDYEVSFQPHQNGIVSSGKNREKNPAFVQNGLQMQHKKGNHGERVGEPNPECELCQKEFA